MPVFGKSVVTPALRVTTGAAAGYVLESDASGNATWQRFPSVVAARTSDTVSITNTETQVLGYTIPAGSSVAGDVYRIVASYTRTGTNAAQATARIRVGATSLGGSIASTLLFPGAATAVSGRLEALVTIRTIGASGTVGGSMANLHNATSPTASVTAAVAVDTTVSRLIELTCISGQSANGYIFQHVIIERLPA